jgi:predicted flavoprotein YhiN
MSILSSVALGWVGRRVLDWGGWLGTFLLTVIGLYNGLPPAAQTAVQAVLSGHWQDITLGSLIPMAALVWSQIASFRATVRAQIVTPQGAKVELDQLPPAAQQDVLVTASQAKPRRTIANAVLDGLIDKLNRNR